MLSSISTTAVPSRTHAHSKNNQAQSRAHVHSIRTSIPSHTTNSVRRKMQRAARAGAGLATVAVSATLAATLMGTPALAAASDLPSGAGVVLNAPVVSVAATPNGRGYWLVGADGGVFAFGNATFHGSTVGLNLNSPIVGIDTTPTGHGYWEVAADGGVFAFGDAGFDGSMSGAGLHAPIVGLAPTADGGGYWLVGADGGVFAFGDANYQGSANGMSESSPIVGIAPTSTGNGYWEVAANGDVYAFGDAPYLGTAPVTSAAIGIDSANDGYRIVSSDGGTYAFGGATFRGSLAGNPLNKPIVGSSSTTGGYVDVAADGGVFNFGSVAFSGSLGGSTLSAPPAPPAVVDYGLTPGQIAAWERVSICEESGNWHVDGSAFSGGLGMSHANWNQFNTFGFPGNAANASKLQQIRVAVAFATHYFGSPNAAPDQNGCTGGY